MQQVIPFCDIVYVSLVVFFYLFDLAIVRLILQWFTYLMTRRRAVASPTQLSIVTSTVPIFSNDLVNLHPSGNLMLENCPRTFKNNTEDIQYSAAMSDP